MKRWDWKWAWKRKPIVALYEHCEIPAPSAPNGGIEEAEEVEEQNPSIEDLKDLAFGRENYTRVNQGGLQVRGWPSYFEKIFHPSRTIRQQNLLHRDKERIQYIVDWARLNDTAVPTPSTSKAQLHGKQNSTEQKSQRPRHHRNSDKSVECATQRSCSSSSSKDLVFSAFRSSVLVPV